jgi:hypothetical protein
MAHFQTKNHNLGKFWRVLQWKMLVYFYVHLVYFRAIWSIFGPFGLFLVLLVYFMVIWYIFSRFGMLYREKSGNPAPVSEKWVCIHVFVFKAVHQSHRHQRSLFSKFSFNFRILMRSLD